MSHSADHDRPLASWRKLIGSAMAVQHTWYLFRQLHPLQQCRWSLQRARHGWSDRDVWSLDIYITRVLAETLVRLAETSHGYPGVEPWDTPEKWDAYLRDMSARIGRWNNDTLEKDDAEAYEASRAAMIEFAENLSLFWD